MKIKDALKSFKNIGWVAESIKPFLKALIFIIILESVESLGSVLMVITTKNLIDLAVKNLLSQALPYAVLFIGIIILNQVIRAFLSVYSTRVFERYSNTIRQNVFSKLINVEWAQVSKYHSGDLLTRLTSDISTVANGSLSILPSIVSLGVELVAAFVTLFSYEPSLAILAFLLIPVVVLVGRYYSRKMSKMHNKIQETESSYRSHIQEFLQNILVIKTFDLSRQSKEKVDELQKERLHWVTERSKAGVLANIFMSMGYWAGYGLAFGWGIIRLASKEITYGTMTAFIQLVNQIQYPFIGLSRLFPQIISALVSAGRLRELEELNTEMTDEQRPAPESAGIRFDGVSFEYEKNDLVLDNVSMEALPGEAVAIMGTSGEGKTTMIRLMLALLKPVSGKVVCFDIDGNEYEISCATRNWFTYVPQGNTLMSGTIAENIRSGKSDATDEEIKEALKMACALEFVESLPDGINTEIGEKAYGLSEGQAQRISIARALIRKAPVLILDEATSALDIELEEKIFTSIGKLFPARTCIIITHRKTALSFCNRVYRLKDGAFWQEVA